MKMTVLAMVVLVLAGSAMAAKDVNFAVVAEGAGVVAIYYDARSAPNLPRAFALDMTVDSAQTLASLSNLSLDYGAYPGSIDINDAGEVNDVGTPEADPCDLPGDTQPGLGSSGVTLEMGSLYVGGANAPDPCGLLLKVMVSYGPECNLTVAENVGRGKVVLQGPTQATTNLPQTVLVMAGWCCTFTIAGNVSSGAAPIRGLADVTITGLPGPPVTDANGDYTATVNGGFWGTTTPTLAQWSIPGKVYTNVHADMLNEDYTATATECFKLNAPGYVDWVLRGSPICWCYRKQCNGDANGDSVINRAVNIADNNILKAAFGLLPAALDEVVVNGTPGICADFDHSKILNRHVNIADNDILKLYFGETEVPQCPDTYINAWTN